MKFRATILCCCAVLAWPAAWAQDPRLVQQALHCSAVIGALAQASSAQTEPSQRWQRAADLLLDVARQAQGPAGAQGLPEQQATVMAQAQQKQRDQAAAYQEDVVTCGAWAEGFLGQGAQVRYVPVYPKIISPAVRAQYEAVIRQWLGESVR